jgi:MoxR-like ATPase
MSNDKSAQEKIGQLEKELNTSFPERKNVIRGILTALIAGEHALMLGPPGTAKSLLARSISNAMAQGDFFEILLTKFTTVDEVFGPVSFSALKKDQFARITEGYAADKKVIFLDEIFKSSSAILNSLLTLMNERIFHNNGKPQKTPLEVVIGASNEYPQDDSLKALYDRFLFKYWVDYIGDQDSLSKLISKGGIDKINTLINAEDLTELRKKTCSFKLSDNDVKTLLEIKAAVEAEGFIASDRTWVKCAKIVKARAILSGRDKITSSDYMILADILWKEHKDRDKLHTLIGNAADPYGARAEAIIDAVKTAMRDLPDFSLLESGQKTKPEMIAMISAVSGQVASRRDTLLDTIEEMDDTSNDTIDEAKTVIEASTKQIASFMDKVTWYRASN